VQDQTEAVRCAGRDYVLHNAPVNAVLACVGLGPLFLVGRHRAYGGGGNLDDLTLFDSTGWAT
jgi:hypothetical protein